MNINDYPNVKELLVQYLMVENAYDTESVKELHYSQIHQLKRAFLMDCPEQLMINICNQVLGYDELSEKLPALMGNAHSNPSQAAGALLVELRDIEIISYIDQMLPDMDAVLRELERVNHE